MLQLPNVNEVTPDNTTETVKKLILAVQELSEHRGAADTTLYAEMHGLRSDIQELKAGQELTNERLSILEVSQQETNKQLTTLNHRVGNLETTQQETNKQLTTLNQRVGKLEVAQQETNTRLDRVETSIKQMKDSVVKEQQETNSLLRQLIAKTT